MVITNVQTFIQHFLQVLDQSVIELTATHINTVQSIAYVLFFCTFTIEQHTLIITIFISHTNPTGTLITDIASSLAGLLQDQAYYSESYLEHSPSASAFSTPHTALTVTHLPVECNQSASTFSIHFNTTKSRNGNYIPFTLFNRKFSHPIFHRNSYHFYIVNYNLEDIYIIRMKMS